MQKQLTESRQRLTLRKNRGRVRRNPSLNHYILNSHSAHPPRHSPIPSTPVRSPRQRIISVSFRLPTLQDRNSVHQQLFDPALPPKAIFSLPPSSDSSFVFLGSTVLPTDVDSQAFGDLYGHGYARWRNIHMRHASREQKPSSPRCVPVTLPDEPGLLSRYYVFCEDILWRLLHYDYASFGNGSDLQQYWSAYRIVNERFAEAISDIYEDGDLIWVHNYHLMLLPSMLRDSIRFANIGFFLYTPFPSAELFRILPHRVEILKGVIGADLVGFHSYDYSKQFVSSCSRLLGLDGTPNAIEADPRIGRRCEIGIYPAGIDVQALKNHTSSKVVKSRVAELRASFDGLKIVVGVDRLDDCFCGIPLKLLAFEQLLTTNPHLVGKVILIQVAMLPRQARNMASYRSQQVQVNEMVGRINSSFGTLAFSPIHYITSELGPTDLHALMCVGHACIVSTVRDGMGLIPHEWTVCQHGGQKGPIILSEFAGAARSFATALHVNPWNVDEVAAKIKLALDMSDTSKNMRNGEAYRFVTSHTAKLWGFNFLDDLEQCDRTASYSGSSALDTVAVVKAYLGMSVIPAAVSLNPMLPNFHSGQGSPFLSANSVGSKLSPMPDRAHLIVLDLDGTLVPFQTLSELGSPSKQVLDAIQNIACSSPLNFVLVISSRDRATVMLWLGELYDVYLAAEDGAFFRAPGACSWTCLVPDTPSHNYHQPQPHHSVSAPSLYFPDGTLGSSLDDGEDGEEQDESQADDMECSSRRIARRNRGGKKRSVFSKGEKPDEHVGSHSFGSLSNIDSNSNDGNTWKSLVLPVMQHFAERTPGVVLEEGNALLTWHYTDSDTDFGRWQARDLHKHLESFLLHRLSIDLVSEEAGPRWIKVRPNGVDKARAVEQTIEHIREEESKNRKSNMFEKGAKGGPYFDFMLCIGDDRADESMFELFRDEGRLDELGVHCASSRVFTCKVGSSATSAMSLLESPAKVIELLEDMVSKCIGSHC